MNDKIQRGNLAQQILDNPIWEEVIDSLEKDMLSELLRYQHEAEKCQRIAYIYDAITQVDASIRDIVATGKIARKQLDD